MPASGLIKVQLNVQLLCSYWYRLFSVYASVDAFEVQFNVRLLPLQVTFVNRCTYKGTVYVQIPF